MKNGFTLVELLAVIVILGIIALISYPIITGIIKDSKDKAISSNAKIYVEGVKKAIMEQQLSVGSINTICIIQDGGDLDCDNEKLPNPLIMDILNSNQIEGGGIITIENGEVIRIDGLTLSNGKQYSYINKKLVPASEN